jgi:death on curing protein
MTNFLSLEDALQIASRADFYLKDAGLLESALARPKTFLFGEDTYPELELKAAALIQAVFKNHPMVDGNKRTSWFLLNAFLYINDYLLEMTTAAGLELTLGVATDQLTLDQAAELIRQHLVRLD